MRLFSTLSVVVFSSYSMFVFAEEQSSNFHFQTTSVTQNHGPFNSPYEGNNSVSPTIAGNSMTPVSESATSLTLTIFGGERLWRGGELYVNPELIGGTGLSHTLGTAGYPNGEIYRVDDSNAKWNLSRLYFKQVIGLGGEQEQIPDDKNQLATQVDVRRLTVAIGKFSLNDFFDNNLFSHDPRTQFLNWSFMDNGAWDYAADTRGYSWGIYLEFNQPRWAVRAASVMVPRYANQLEMDKNVPSHRGDNLEFEYRYKISDSKGVARVMAYENIANMGSYRATLDTSASGMDVTRTRDRRTKYGFGLNLQQEITENFGAFSRLSWNDGHTETWAFTEIDRTMSLGVNANGRLWRRPSDNAGLGFVVNLLSDDHRDYLAAGGYGFIIGDGRLTYGAEQIAEFYYLYHVMDGMGLTGDYQFVINPAYNVDRGPISIFSLRLHYEI